MLTINNLSFGYSDQNLILNNFNFKIKKGEHLCVMGESGCGKSTLLKAIYGLLDLSGGEILWDKEKVLGPKDNLVPGFELFKYVPQDFELMPFTSVSENINVYLSRFYPEESKARTKELLKVIDMELFANRKVKNLSGGQKQRVAIAKALAKKPSLLLLDEPFSQIDNFKKNKLRRNLFQYLKNNDISCIVATHDKDDALSFADKIIIIKDSKILENNSPNKIFRNPNSYYVASLFDDCNEIFINQKNYILFPHEIEIIESSNYKAKVLNSFFKGYYWIVECYFNKKKIYIHHNSSIKKDKIIFFKIKKSP